MKNLKTILIAVGGTGGHLYPAFAMALELQEKLKDYKFVFIGEGLDKNPFFDRSLFPFHVIESSSCSNKSIWTLLISLYKILKGIVASSQIIKKSSPIAIIGFGSFHAFPALAAAKEKKIPMILFESNAILGKVNRFFSKKAHLNIYQLFDLKQRDHSNFIKGKMPLLASKIAPFESKAAKEHFGLDPSIFTILVFGGSQGALTMNQLVAKALILASKSFSFQILHFTGFNTNFEEIKRSYDSANLCSCVKPFEQNMALAYAAANCIISRSGSNTIAEALHHKIPAFYLPYPFLKDQHQLYNAKYVSETLGSASYAMQKELKEDLLAQKLLDFLENQTFFKTNLEKICQTEEGLSEIVAKTLKEIEVQ